jgi:phage terminase large subunit-like protein
VAGRPSKNLLEHVQDGSFMARRHADLLEAEPDLRWPALAALQQQFRESTEELQRRALALEFEHAVRAAHATSQAEAGNELERELARLTLLLDELGPRGSPERIINFFPRFLWHTKGLGAGEPFELDEWQKRMIRASFKRAPYKRRKGRVFRWLYRRIYWVIPGGNGKTPLAAGLGLLALCELEDAPEIYCLAGAKEQADIAHEFARLWVEGDQHQEEPELKAFLRVRGKRILNKRTGGRMTIVASAGPILEGRAPSVLIVDELHAFETKMQEQSYTALSGKLHKRPDSYLLAISTAGRGEQNILRRIIKDALKFKRVTRRGFLTIARDDEKGIILYMYAAPQEAPLEGKAGLEVIRKVNPASWLDPRDIVQQLADAGAGESEFRRLARNEWIASRNQWIAPGLWDARADRAYGRPPAKAEIALAFDGSYDNDSTALVGCTPDKHLFVLGVWERPEGDRDWVVPRDIVKAAVDEAMATYDVRNFMCDPPGWYDEIEEWGRKYQDVMTVEFFTNQTKLMAAACREFYSDVVQKQLTHDGNEVLARHLANAYTRETADGAQIVKEHRKSTNKIDAAIAAVLARYGAVRMKPRRSNRLVSW